MAKRRCTAKTKAGKRCRNQPLAGTDLCIAHQPRKVKDSLGFGGPQPGSGRPRHPRVIEVLRDRVDADVDAIVDVYVDALGAERSLVVGSGEFASIETAPDHQVRLKAADALLDRAHGRPVQVTQITGAEGPPVRVSADVDNPEVRELAHELLKRRVEAAKTSSG